jgi:1-aminocyclopropane-1-carboxylate deaminase/D-cysteine desulfhydrase-like pyridoxal-dependent ACC family enzyme
MSWAMVAVAGVSLASGIISSSRENKKARDEERKKLNARKRMKQFEANRQPVINQADEIRALKEQAQNPYANLPVATQAAEMQMEQTDQALANTLDTIRSTGSGAGGATALAQAAAQSKSKVTASIQQQEATNAKAAAQGEASLQKNLQDLEVAALNEEGRAWGKQEKRDLVQLNRMQSEIEGAEAAQYAYEGAADQALMEGVGGSGSALGQADFTTLGNP